MIKPEIFHAMALSLPGTETRPHFDRVGFRVTGKRMFATYLAKDNTANIFLTAPEQKLFCQMSPGHIYPVPNKWGEKGATTFELDQLPREYVMEALFSAYNAILIGKK
jgi:YjbR